jgi:hypothetical protein
MEQLSHFSLLQFETFIIYSHLYGLQILIQFIKIPIEFEKRFLHQNFNEFPLNLTRRLGIYITPIPLCFQPWDVESLAENLFSNIIHPFMIIVF